MHAVAPHDRSDDAAEGEPRETWVEPHLPAPDGIAGQYRREVDSDGHTTVTIEVTMTDPELAAIEACLVTLQTLPYATRVRALTYIKDRVESDPNVWGIQESQPVARREIARLLAEEADGRDWATMSPEHQSPYYRRADVLTTGPLAVVARMPG